MARNYLIAGKTAWDLGNFNYDSVIDINDAKILQKNYNGVASGSVVASTAAAVNAGAGGGVWVSRRRLIRMEGRFWGW